MSELYKKKIEAMQKDERYRIKIYQEVKKAGGMMRFDADGFMTQIAPLENQANMIALIDSVEEWFLNNHTFLEVTNLFVKTFKEEMIN